MPSKRSTLVSRSRVAISVVALACALSATAEAGSRAAPIVFKGDNVTTAAPVRYVQAPSVPTPQPRAVPADKANARIEFRYPDSQLAPGEYVPASASTLPAAPAARESAFVEAPQVILPPKPVVESSSLQALPEPAGKGMGYAPLTPAPQPIAAAPASGEFVETGIAVVYGQEFVGLPTANGEVFSQGEMTAAHPSLPLPSLIYVTNLDTGREVVVRVNDRGPFEDGANLQLSQKAAEALGMNPSGKGNVRLRYLSHAPIVATQPGAQRPATRLAPVVKQPEVLPVAPQMASVPAPAEDELLGGGAFGAPAPAPRLMSMTVAPTVATYSAPVAASGDVFVQLASFSDIGNAEAMLRRVEGQLPVEIVPARVNGADFFRVRVGPFDGRDAAEQVRARLSAEGTADGRIVSGS